MKVGDKLSKEWKGESLGDTYMITKWGKVYIVEVVEIDKKFGEVVFEIIKEE